MRSSLACLLVTAITTTTVLVGCAKTAPQSAGTAPVGVTQRDSATRASGAEAELVKKIGDLAEQHDVPAAIALATAELKLKPTSIALLHTRATLLWRANQPDKALSDLATALKLAPGDAVLLNNRGFLYLGLKQYPEARRDFDEAMQVDPTYAQPCNNCGLIEMAMSRYAQAIERFNAALTRDPNYVDAYNNRGFAEVELQQFEPALADFTTAIRLDPKYVNAYNNRGILKVRAGDFDSAIVDFTQASMLDPENPKYYRHRRDTYLRLEQFDKARQDERRIDQLEKLQSLSIALTTNPTAAAYLARAQHRERFGQIAEAYRDVARALELEPANGTALAQRASLHLAEHNYRQAIEDCNEALEQEEVPLARSVRGDASLALGDYDQALADFDFSRRIDSAVAEAFFRKSQQLEQQGATEDARTQRERALALDPEVEHRLR